MLMGYLRVHLSCEVVAQVPSKRPDSFVLVERTGGRYTRFADYPDFAVQAWGLSKAEASALAQTVAKLIDDWPAAVSAVAEASVESIYDFTDPDSRSPRFQLTAHAVLFATEAPSSESDLPDWDLTGWDHL
nr:MAG TPA: tail completion protein [Caudoviricetes sp.]